MEDEIFDIKQNFWKLHPQFKFIGNFKTLYEQEEGQLSSKVMWFLKYIYHQKSQLYNAVFEERIEMCETQIFEEKGFYEEHKETIFDPLGEDYCKVVDSAIDRTIRLIDKKLDEKNKFLESKDYDLETFEEIDKAILNYDKQITLLEKLKASRRKEVASKKVGDTELSEADKGLM